MGFRAALTVPSRGRSITRPSPGLRPTYTLRSEHSAPPAPLVGIHPQFIQNSSSPVKMSVVRCPYLAVPVAEPFLQPYGCRPLEDLSLSPAHYPPAGERCGEHEVLVVGLSPVLVGVAGRYERLKSCFRLILFSLLDDARTGLISESWSVFLKARRATTGRRSCAQNRTCVCGHSGGASRG
jgi:hypothetical protein